MQRQLVQPANRGGLAWSDVFPFLTALPADEPGLRVVADWADKALGPSPLRSYGKIADLSWIAAQFFPSWRLGQLFPTVGQGLTVDDLAGLGTRGRNAIARWSGGDLDLLLGATPREVMDLPHVGAGTIDDLFQCLIRLGLDEAALSDWCGGTESDTEELLVDRAPARQAQSEGADIAALPNSLRSEAIESILQAMRTLAEWQSARDQFDSPILDRSALEGSPRGVVIAWDYLAQLRPRDVLAQRPPKASVVLNGLLRQLDDRQLVIARRRIFSDVPATLDELGTELGVTRERVRQIEGKLKAELGQLTLHAFDTPTGKLAAAVRQRIGRLCPLEDLVVRFPELTAVVDAVAQPVWRVLDWLDDGFEVHGDWAAVPSISDVWERTVSIVEDLSDDLGVAPLEPIAVTLGLSLPDHLEVLARWLARGGFEILGEFVLSRTRSASDHAAAILRVAGHPLSTEEIVDLMGGRRTVGSVKNALSLDERLTRADRDKWALSSWGLDEYTGIRDLMRREISRAGGSVALADLVENLTGRFTVSASSVVTYAGAPPFVTRNGVVSVHEGSIRLRKTPAQTKHLYRRGSDWCLRLVVTPDHLRGSGFPIPIALAGLLGVSPGTTVALTSDAGEQHVHWAGAQPALGSIRRFLVADDVAAGESVFACFLDDGCFAVELLRGTGALSPLDGALALVGGGAELPAEGALCLIARALGLPDGSSLAAVIGAARDRGEEDLAELLLSLPGEDSEAPTRQGNPEMPGVDDILALL